MVFKKQYGNYYLAKLWRHYNPISKREINAIIKNYGRKPYLHLNQVNRAIYDETSESFKPLRQHTKRGNSTYQIAIFNNTLYLRHLDKPLTKLNKIDLLSFYESLNKLIPKLVLITDKRFLRFKLNPKYFSIFKKEDHNMIHRLIGLVKIYVYKQKLNYTSAWLKASNKYGLKLVWL